MTTAITCTVVLALLVFGLGMNVSRMRGVQHKAGRAQYPSDPADPLFKAIRAHGNASEYVPTLAILFLLVGHRHPGAGGATLIIAATGARIVHAIGIFTSPSLATKTPLRLVGAAGTYLCGIGLALLTAWSL